MNKYSVMLYCNAGNGEFLSPLSGTYSEKKLLEHMPKWLVHLSDENNTDGLVRIDIIESA